MSTHSRNHNLVFLALALLFVFARPSSAQSMEGKWVCVDPQFGGARAFEIKDGAVCMRGKCAPGTLREGVLHADLDAGFSIKSTEVTALPDGTLRMAVRTHFTDDSGRVDYTSVSVYKHAPASEAANSAAPAPAGSTPAAATPAAAPPAPTPLVSATTPTPVSAYPDFRPPLVPAPPVPESILKMLEVRKYKNWKDINAKSALCNSNEPPAIAAEGCAKVNIWIIQAENWASAYQQPTVEYVDTRTAYSARGCALGDESACAQYSLAVAKKGDVATAVRIWRSPHCRAFKSCADALTAAESQSPAIAQMMGGGVVATGPAGSSLSVDAYPMPPIPPALEDEIVAIKVQAIPKKDEKVRMEADMRKEFAQCAPPEAQAWPSGEACQWLSEQFELMLKDANRPWLVGHSLVEVDQKLQEVTVVRACALGVNCSHLALVLLKAGDPMAGQVLHSSQCLNERMCGELEQVFWDYGDTRRVENEQEFEHGIMCANGRSGDCYDYYTSVAAKHPEEVEPIKALPVCQASELCRTGHIEIAEQNDHKARDFLNGVNAVLGAVNDTLEQHNQQQAAANDARMQQVQAQVAANDARRAQQTYTKTFSGETSNGAIRKETLVGNNTIGWTDTIQCFAAGANVPYDSFSRSGPTEFIQNIPACPPPPSQQTTAPTPSPTAAPPVPYQKPPSTGGTVVASGAVCPASGYTFTSYGDAATGVPCTPGQPIASSSGSGSGGSGGSSSGSSVGSGIKTTPALTNCLAQSYVDGDLTVTNTCNVPVYATWWINGHGGSWTLNPGEHTGTGYSSSDVAVGGASYYVCPKNASPTDSSGNALTGPVSSYVCVVRY